MSFNIQSELNPTKWQNTNPYRLNKHSKYINEYYIHNTQNILGKLEVVNVRGKEHLVCKDNGNLQQKLNDIIVNFTTPVKHKNTQREIDLTVRVNKYLNSLLSKHWNELLQIINKKRNLFLPKSFSMKIKKPECKIEHIKYNYSFNLDNWDSKNISDILIETKLKEEDYYFEIKLSFDKRIPHYLNYAFDIEYEVESFIKKKIESKFKYKLYFKY